MAKYSAGDYVSWKEDETVQYGKVKTVSGDNLTIKRYDEKDDTTGAVSELKDLGKSSYARLMMQAKPNSWEVVENVGVAALYNGLVRKRPMMGSEMMTFALGDITHEFLTKPFTNSFADFFKPAELKKDARSWFELTDLTDAAAKTPFVSILQAIYGKLLFKKQFTHDLIHNLIANAGIFAVSNFGDRMWTADEKATPQYRYV